MFQQILEGQKVFRLISLPQNLTSTYADCGVVQVRYVLFRQKEYQILSYSTCILKLLIDVKDLPIKPRYLVTFTVGYEQRKNIDAAVKKVGI